MSGVDQYINCMSGVGEYINCMSALFPLFSPYPLTSEPMLTTLFQSMEHIGPALEEAREGGEG